MVARYTTRKDGDGLYRDVTVTETIGGEEVTLTSTLLHRTPGYERAARKALAHKLRKMEKGNR